MSHVFNVGQFIQAKSKAAIWSGSVYEIVRLMPVGTDGLPQYRVKGLDGERIITEREIQPARSAKSSNRICDFQAKAAR
jgi:hypothetical protein